jgi:hypothetical protein
MTLHFHKIDDRTLVSDGDKLSQVPAGWQIAVGDADDMRVCGAHAWQSTWLVFTNGESYGTGMSSCPGKNSLLQHRKQLIFFSRLKIGKKGQGGSGRYLIQDAREVGCNFSTLEVLLRRRA